MYTKKMLSMAAAAAIISTGALAFDTDSDGRILGIGSKHEGSYNNYYYKSANGMEGNSTEKNSSTIEKRSASTYDELKKDSSVIIKKGPGAIGDALIFPAFYAGGETLNGKSNWKSEFSIINTSEEAVIAKVVLYGGVNSQELRDFNIYLSAHDVFRATLKDGKIISTDGSTVAYNKDLKNASTTTINPKFDEDKHKNTNYLPTINEYKYEDNVTMASKDNPLDMYVDPAEALGADNRASGIGLYVDSNNQKQSDFEHNGYIVVYAMAQAEGEKYHGKHKELWQDYRHLLDTCRNTDIKDGRLQEWRDGINGGIYTERSITLPNVSENALGRKEIYGRNDLKVCSTVFNSALSDDDNIVSVKFKSPSASLTGSILISHDNSDKKGSRDMLLKAYALDNYSVPGQEFLWTEGEFASIQDRRLLFKHYDIEGILKDADVFNLKNTYYEFMDNNTSLSKLLVTQPYKRVLIRLNQSQNAWHNIGEDVLKNKAKNNGLDEYGEFDLSLRIYNDNEENYIPQLNGFTVSPATAGSTKGIPYELSIFSPLANMSKKDKDLLQEKYPKGYVVIKYDKGDIPGIVTQMGATVHPNGEAETNWFYPFSTYAIDD